MELIETLVVVFHVLCAVGLIIFILLQQGKGADAGAAFGGGASQTIFGSQGSATFLSKFTAFLATLFFITSFSLAVFAKQKADLAADPYQVGAPAQVDEAELQTPELDAPVQQQAPVQNVPADVQSPQATDQIPELDAPVQQAPDAELESAPAETQADEQVAPAASEEAVPTIENTQPEENPAAE